MKRLVVVAALLALTGCGGGSSSVGGPPPGGPTGLPTGLPTTPPSAAASVLAGLKPGACRDIGTQLVLAGQAFTSSTGGTPSQRFAAVAARLESARDEVRVAAVRDALATVVAKLRQVAKDLTGVTYDSRSGKPPPKQYDAALQSLNAPEFTSASRLLSSYLSAGCK
jgi:hypothetical protein